MEYVSCDPNIDLHPLMKLKIVESSKHKNFIIHKNGFLEVYIQIRNLILYFQVLLFLI